MPVKRGLKTPISIIPVLSFSINCTNWSIWSSRFVGIWEYGAWKLRYSYIGDLERPSIPSYYYSYYSPLYSFRAVLSVAPDFDFLTSCTRPMLCYAPSMTSLRVAMESLLESKVLGALAKYKSHFGSHYDDYVGDNASHDPEDIKSVRLVKGGAVKVTFVDDDPMWYFKGREITKSAGGMFGAGSYRNGKSSDSLLGLLKLL